MGFAWSHRKSVWWRIIPIIRQGQADLTAAAVNLDELLDVIEDTDGKG
jgi:hypothetical protein